MEAPDNPIDLRSCQWSLTLAISVVAAVFYLASGSVGYAWPAIDMAPYFIAKTTGALGNDFFAQCSLLPNPRQVFGQLLLAAGVFGLSWSRTLLFVEASIAVLLPIMMYSTVATIYRHLARAPSRLGLVVAAAAALALLLSDDLQRFLTVAWWRPIYLQATPHNFALVFGAAGIVLACARGWRYGLGLLALLLAACVHPVIALSCALIAATVLQIHRFALLPSVLVVAVAVVGTLAVTVYFALESTVIAAEFVRIYAVEAHPSHYLPSQFTALYRGPWYASFIIQTVLLVGAAAWLWRRRDKHLALLLLIFATYYVGSILLQFVGVELIGSKLIATLGPSRFTFWGAWFLGLGAAAVVGVVAHGRFARALRPLGAPRARAMVVATTVTVLGSASFAVLRHGDSFFSLAEARNGPILRWIRTYTVPDSIFLLPHGGGLRADVPIAARRAAFLAAGFPFNESCFEEHARRSVLSDGSATERARVAGSWIGAKIQAVYDSRSPQYLAQLAANEGIDYVVLSPKHFDRFDSATMPVYRDGRYAVLTATQLEDIAREQLQ
jgi:hypothetical protein